VIAVPGAVVRGVGKDLAALQLLQGLLAAAPIEEAIAERATQAAQHACAHKEPAQFHRQLFEDVAGQVLAGEAGARPHRAQDPAALLGRLAPGRQMEELQTGRPTLGAAGQLRQLLRRERLLVEVTEKALNFPGPEAQVLAADLQERPRDPQPREVEARDSPGADQESDGWWRIVDQPLQEEFGWAVLQGMQVVAHKQGSLARPGLP